MESVNKGTRIVNYTIDIIIIGIISVIPVLIFQYLIHPTIISYIVMILYYYFFESTTGQTIGKKATKTIVVDLNNSKPSNYRILLRTVLRLNPFDGLSYLFGQEQGAHDIISRTKLIRKI